MATINTLLPVEQFNNKIVAKKLALTPKTFRQAYDVDNSYTTLPTVKKFKQIQDFFDVDKIFEENAWQSDIHKAYEYENFSGKIIKLYTLYSPQVLTYQSLASFLDLIENKFKPIIKDFIPIVINISEFGRLIQNSGFIVPKVHYPNVHRLCQLQKIGQSILQFRLFEKVISGVNLTISAIHGNNTVFLSPITVTWTGTEGTMEIEVLRKLRNPVTNPFYAHFKSYLNDGILILELDAAWYNTTYSQDPNAVKFVIQPVGGARYTGLFDHGSLDFSINDCGSVEYAIPPIKDVAGVNTQYLFFESEKRDLTTTFAEENEPDTFLT